jgi:multidrug efflux pump subunit AcrB
MSGIPGKFFKQFGWTASLAVFASLVVARVLTPMMAAYILKPIVTAAHEPAWLKRYMVWATWCMKHRFVTMVLATLFFIGSIMLVPLLPKGFIPPDDNSQTQVYVELPPGSNLAQTQASAEHARQLLMTVKDHHRWRQCGHRPLCGWRCSRGAQSHTHHPADRARHAPAQASD